MKNTFILPGDSSGLGCEFTYIVQENPEGLGQAVILGNNIFYSPSISNVLQASKDPGGGVVFAYCVSDPERYGVVELDSNDKALTIEEKPAEPKIDLAVPGLYFYDNRVVEIAKNLKPSKRGELVTTDVNKQYLEGGELEIGVLDRGTAWLDTGTFASLQKADGFVEIIEERQGLKVGCIEELAYEQDFIDGGQLKQVDEPLVKSGYGE